MVLISPPPRVLLILHPSILRLTLILILILYLMETKSVYLLHLAGSTAEKSVTLLIAADCFADLTAYIFAERLDVVQFQKLPDNIVIV